MTSAHFNPIATNYRYDALLAVSAAIIAHRDLCALFHDLAGRLRQVVRFDYLTLVLHEVATNTMRMHVLEPPEPTEAAIGLPPEEDPAGLVWQTQQPLITSSLAELGRWPRLLKRVQPYRVQSYCWLPPTTARLRLGTLVFTSKELSAYEKADVGFTQLVASQFDARWLIAAGLVVMAVGNFWMARMNLQISPWQVVGPRMVLTLGLGLLFAPMSVAA
jgi:hypothetical protein